MNCLCFEELCTISGFLDQGLLVFINRKSLATHRVMGTIAPNKPADFRVACSTGSSIVGSTEGLFSAITPDAAAVRHNHREC
jgi:hypothetical protein